MILVGDCLEVMRTMDAESVDSIVTDPPYHLTTGKRGGTGAASDNPNSPAGRARIGTGFMGKAWDGGDIAHRVETWAEALRVAKPGAWLAAFGGTRTFHRLACAIEDAGWELRDSVLRGHQPLPEDCPWLAGWMFGSGFPKSRNGEWGGTALKPAWEPIVLARKPLIGTVEANWREHGTGALNIGGCRVHMNPTDRDAAKVPMREVCGDAAGGGHANTARDGSVFEPALNGRWPANLVHDGSEEVLAQFPHTSSPATYVRNIPQGLGDGIKYGTAALRGEQLGYGDTGSAARFFYCSKADRADRNDGCDGMAERPLLWSSGEQSPGTFQAEGTKRAAANNHPTVKPTDLMRWLCRLVTPAGGLVLDPFTGSGSTGRGAIAEGFRFQGIELDPEYAAIAEARIRAVQPGLAFGDAA